MSNLVDHARRELSLVGEEPWIIDGLCKVVAAFAEMGHSGSSAAHATDALEKLLRFKNLSPLSDSPGEWIDRHAEGMSPVPCWQSARNSDALSADGGKTYYLVSELQAAGSMDATPVYRAEPTP